MFQTLTGLTWFEPGIELVAFDQMQRAVSNPYRADLV